MIAANEPLSEILSNFVLLIEAKSPEMLCSILLFSDDGNHVRHAVAPRKPLPAWGGGCDPVLLLNLCYKTASARLGSRASTRLQGEMFISITS